MQQIFAIPNGSRFYRADLHIHSYGASHDVKDTTMTPDAIVKTAIAEKLDIIAITDHNEISNVELAIKTSVGSELLVIPGIELSTSQGHLLCYTPDFDSLHKLFGRLNIVDRGLQNSRCQNSILECLNLVDELKGFCVLAHVDAPSGFEIENPGYSPHKNDVLCHKALLGIELKSALSKISYSSDDDDAHRALIGKQRISQLNLGSNQFLARVLNSDAHTLQALGRNSIGNKKVTRFKMDKPSFSAIRIALEDSDARVRIEDQIPNAVPKIVGMRLEGGFLDGQQIHFSQNLNCLVGGRGTGKSTTFEAVRCLAQDRSNKGVIDSEIWPNKITFFWSDQANQVHHLVRSLGGPVVNVNNSQNGPTAFQIECYGQGETERISKEAQTNPVALLTYLDKFVDFGNNLKEEIGYRESLIQIQKEIDRAKQNVDLIPQYQKTLAITQQQLEALEKAKAKEIIELLRQLAQERTIRSQINQKLVEIKSLVDSGSPKKLINEILSLADPAKLRIGSAEFSSIVQSAKKFESDTDSIIATEKSEYSKLHSLVTNSIAQWAAKEAEIQKKIEEIRKDLASKNIPLDMTYIQKLANEEAQNKTNLANAETWKPHLLEQNRLYKETSLNRWKTRSRISMLRSAFARESSTTLKSVLTDLQVSLKFIHSAYSPTAEELIKQTMGWRTTQVPRAGILIYQLTLPGLLEAIDKKDSNVIKSILTVEKTPVFDQSEADRIIKELGQPQVRHSLEVCDAFDIPLLTITKGIKDANGKVIYVQREFAKLSLGQQQSVLLALMLSSKSTAPLIIDQPEDNLDGEFIYHSLVPVLRLAKERRQIIIVTHNANIAVLGDAEQIIILKSTNDKCQIYSRGSIDDTNTKEIACSILEGAKEAFQRRAKIYGVLN